MAIFRLQCTFKADGALPRDNMVITPHFEGSGLLAEDTDALCEDLATALHDWTSNIGGTREITVKSYNAQGAPPQAPSGSAIRNVLAAPASAHPRELALCLSFFHLTNTPRRRGRLYIPVILAVNQAVQLSVRPTSTMMNSVGALATTFQELGGTDIDWVVYSRADDDAKPVTNWYVDDEWDIMRSRGLRSSSRVQGTTSEN